MIESTHESDIDNTVFVIVENENKKHFKNEDNNHNPKSTAQNDDPERIEMKSQLNNVPKYIKYYEHDDISNSDGDVKWNI